MSISRLDRAGVQEFGSLAISWQKRAVIVMKGAAVGLKQLKSKVFCIPVACSVVGLAIPLFGVWLLGIEGGRRLGILSEPNAAFIKEKVLRAAIETLNEVPQWMARSGVGIAYSGVVGAAVAGALGASRISKQRGAWLSAAVGGVTAQVFGNKFLKLPGSILYGIAVALFLRETLRDSVKAGARELRMHRAISFSRAVLHHHISSLPKEQQREKIEEFASLYPTAIEEFSRTLVKQLAQSAETATPQNTPLFLHSTLKGIKALPDSRRKRRKGIRALAAELMLKKGALLTNLLKQSASSFSFQSV